ncbi:peptidoglycan D,D-transpeptidase FtsI family protein [Oceanobacillus manasiensis]|uniref:peptidoglycan D,D-transpeptidase FtsI family protein n=1 Tax=Oceanobacillus manasiensis TaxID=586413 RepID=UPI0005AB4BF1|nr:penicillin-binding protein 2 [Oceanobacillus manasiensis]
MGNKKRRKKAQLPFRINILFFVVFLMFSVLVLQLGVVQILNGEAFQEEIDRTIQDTTKIPVPRGKIYDSNHRVVVDNKPLYSITYTPAKGTQAEEKLDVAEKLATFISMDSEDDLAGITDRNKQEYVYLKTKEDAEERVTPEEKKELSNSEFYQLVLERIPEEDLKGISKEEYEVIAIKKELDKAYSLTPQIVKNEDVTAEEYAKVAEHLDELPGVNATTDWDRDYPYGYTFKNLLGSITSQEQGIPADSEAYYMTRGYSRNDRVGKSGLEEYYEESLRGRKEQIQYTTTKSGRVIDTKTIVEGQRGKDLVLTVDLEFQEEVDKIVREELKAARSKHPHANRYLKDAIAVVMNPKTGDILAMSGQTYDEKNDEYNNSEYKAMQDAHRPGSIVKGATVLAGYESGVITPGQVFNDRTINIAGTPSKSSYSNLGPVNDYEALRRSSNVYMFYIALKMGGENRYPFPNESKAAFDTAAWQQMRNYFQQFGLGVKTGIDYPFESTGYSGKSARDPGLLMDFAIGQYDTFTTLQMAQYVSTIANDGYRVSPHFLKEIREPGVSDEKLGSISKSVNTKVLNRIQMDQDLIARVQEGFRQAFQEQRGTGTSHFGDKDYNPAGKTGTAEDEVYENGVKTDVENLSLVGYAPFDDPEVAFAVIAPKTGIVKNQYSINKEIGSRILDTYFDLKEERVEKEIEENEEEN